MPNPRDTVRYSLWRGHTKVYVGITNDPERREDDHRRDGLDFDQMRIEGPRVTRGSAFDWEKDVLEAYKRGHGGDPPEYND